MTLPFACAVRTVPRGCLASPLLCGDCIWPRWAPATSPAPCLLPGNGPAACTASAARATLLLVCTFAWWQGTNVVPTTRQPRAHALPGKRFSAALRCMCATRTPPPECTKCTKSSAVCVTGCVSKAAVLPAGRACGAEVCADCGARARGLRGAQHLAGTRRRGGTGNITSSDRAVPITTGIMFGSAPARG